MELRVQGRVIGKSLVTTQVIREVRLFELRCNDLETLSCKAWMNRENKEQEDQVEDYRQ